MKRSRFSEEKIVAVLKTAEAGVPVEELCREHGISRATFYLWRKKYGGLEVDDAGRGQAETHRRHEVGTKKYVDTGLLKMTSEGSVSAG